MAMTEEQKKAASERMKAMHAKKKAEKEQPVEVKEKVYNQDDVEALKRQIEELKDFMRQSTLNTPAPQMQTAQVQGTKLVGVTDRYSVNPDDYPDPTKRLSEEPRLRPYAFDINYDIDYKFSTTSYQTKEGLNMKEPKMELELSRVKLDELGNPTPGRYLISKATFFEDPQSAMEVAAQLGVDVNEYNQKDFLNEMRYMQMRDWLLENFFPPETFNKKSNKREEVIGGKLVQYFEITSQNSSSIPFEQIGDNKKY